MKYKKDEVTRTGYYARAQEFKKGACEKCGSVVRLHVHHKDRNWRNNAKSNLETLCATCHNQEHHSAGDYTKSGPHYKGARCRFCDDEAKKTGMCNKHYLRVQRTGTHEIIKKQKEKCLHCKKYASRGGMCEAHYQRMRRHGTPDKVPTRAKPREHCFCGEPAYVKGFCNKHYLRFRRHGHPLAGASDKPRK